MTIVVKIGGGAGIDPANALADLAQRRSRQGAGAGDWILVHGASDEATALGASLGHPPRFVTSVSGHVSRFTDDRTLEIFTMASALVNARLVARLQALGVNAVGLSGIDGRLLEADRKDHVKALIDGKRVVLRGDHTGTVHAVNTDLLARLLGAGYAPVVGVPALGTGNVPVNADADRAAAQIAVAMKADALVILSNVPGLLADVNDASSLVRRVPRAEMAKAAELAQGRFKKKVMGADEALALGVPRVVFAAASEPSCVTRALAGEIGTTLGDVP
ncbi:MAG: [LysW]-aminoadipate kinase [Thermoplasmatota archaeon]